MRLAATALLISLVSSLRASSPELDRELLDLPSLQRLQQSVRHMAAFGSRLTGSSGEAATLDYVQRRLTAAGFRVSRETFSVTIPDPEARGLLRTAERQFELDPLWPNLVRTSTCNVQGRLIDGGNGSLEALEGQDPKGAVVLVELGDGAKWMDAVKLGAAGIVFLGSADPVRTDLEETFRSYPLDIPRFLCHRSDVEQLRRLARRAPLASLSCRQDWKRAESANLIADLDGRDPGVAGEPIALWAYVDAMSVTPGRAPGGDQASGLLALLELSEIWSRRPHRRPIRLVFSGAHALALQGAREYVERRFAEGGRPPLVVVTLDLSTDSEALGVFGRGYAYNTRDEILQSVQPLARKLRAHAERLADLLRVPPRVVLTDAVNHSDNRTWRNNLPARFAFDCEPFMSAGYAAVTFATTDAARLRTDTPADTFDRVNLTSLRSQIGRINVMLHHLLNDPIAPVGGDVVPMKRSAARRISLIGGFASATGYVAVYDPTRSLVPDVRVTDSLAVRITGSRTLMGVRGNEVQLTTGPNAEFRFMGLPPVTGYATRYKPPTVVTAYHVDPVSGQVDYAPDSGPFGEDAFPTSSQLKTTLRASPVVVFPCRAIQLFGLSDPQELAPFWSEQVLEPGSGGRPRNYSISRASFTETSMNEADDGAVLFLPKGQRWQLLMGSEQGEHRLLLIGKEGKKGENEAGSGYDAPSAGSASFGDVGFSAARDLCALNQARIDRFAPYRMVVPAVIRLHRHAESELAASRAAVGDRRWVEAQRHTRAAWALALRVHPVLQGAAADAVNGVIFYSFLLIPFSLFFERLVFASRSLGRRLAGTAAVFIGAFLLLRALHPAFDLVSNPAMIFVGFIMGALSLLVSAFVVGKFETALRAVKQARSGIRELDVRRGNVAMAAFSLGISNLRRRRARTLLTVVTLAAMTFIVLSFTSISPELQLRQNASSNSARYSGLLLRDPGLEPLQPEAYRALVNEFAGRARVARRVYTYGKDILDGPSIAFQHGASWADANAVIGLDADEARLTRPNEALLPGGRWFLAGERDAVVLPVPLAEKLGIRPEEVGKARVRHMGLELTVVGLLDPERLRAVTDLDGDAIFPPNFSLSRQEQQSSRSLTRAFRKFIRLDPAVCAILPAETASLLGGDLRGIAVGFDDPTATAAAMESLMPRLRFNLYAAVAKGQGLEVRQFSVIQGSRSSGLGFVLIQIALASLFVLNTMIASVFERTREISIFSAVGLAPSHISTLFFAESLVYGVLGTVFGYFAAQGVAKWVVATGAFPALTLNFSSGSALLSAGLVVGTVLASTIYPARIAARIAAPAQAERALATEPEDDVWILPLPFSVPIEELPGLLAFLAEWMRGHEQYAIGEFVTQDVRLGERTLAAQAWLAPYDLGVSQRLKIAAQIQGNATDGALELRLERLAGEPRNWVLVNRRFLESLRRQFLAWRSLDERERERFALSLAG